MLYAKFLKEVIMLGPDPAVLFWLPIGIMAVVLAGGFMVYYLANSNPGTSK